MEMIIRYLRRFAAWGTALRERYANDLFFRTTARIEGLEACAVLALAAALLLALVDPAEEWLYIGAGALAAAGAGFVVVRLALTPVRETLYYQKRFIGNVAHELRTPLSIIKTSTEVALINEELPGATRKTFIETRGELDRISEIIDNLVSLNTLTRPERMQLHNVDLAPLVSEVAGRHLPLARERDLKLVIKKSRPMVVWGNVAGLEQIVANLVKNAISYTPKGARGSVTVWLEDAGDDCIKLSVADTGIGISKEDLRHIFEPFYRADTSRVRTVKHGGSGLGLTIVNELVRAHHGKIQIHSERKKGTRVDVFFPRGRGLEPREHGAPGRLMFDFSFNRGGDGAARLRARA